MATWQTILQPDWSIGKTDMPGGGYKIMKLAHLASLTDRQARKLE